LVEFEVKGSPQIQDVRSVVCQGPAQAGSGYDVTGAKRADAIERCLRIFGKWLRLGLSDFLDRDQRPLSELSELFSREELLRASDDGCLEARAICFLFKLKRVPFSSDFADGLVIVRATKEGESTSLSLG